MLSINSFRKKDATIVGVTIWHTLQKCLYSQKITTI